MSSSFVSSSNLKVFPCGNRATSDQQARLTTEYNLTNIINRLVDNKSFVITDTYDADKPLEFNINGYYFCIINMKEILNNWSTDDNSIYASINIIKNDTDSTGNVAIAYWQQLGKLGTSSSTFTPASDDISNSEFNGLQLSSSIDTITTQDLLLLVRDGNTWKIPSASKCRIKIDDGDLDKV